VKCFLYDIFHLTYYVILFALMPFLILVWIEQSFVSTALVVILESLEISFTETCTKLPIPLMKEL